VLGAYLLIIDGAAGSVFGISETLTRATPLIFTGLAAAFAFRAGFWNIGGEGQLYVGALVAVVLGSGLIVLPAALMIPLLMLAGALASGILLFVSAVLKVKLGADEVVTTLLLNFVAVLVISTLISGPLEDPMGMGWPQSEPVIESAQLPKLYYGMRLHLGFVIGVLVALVIWWVNAYTTFGYEARAVGLNHQAANFAGIPVSSVILKVSLLSGGLAGLAGVSEVCGLRGNLALDLSPGFGYAGIIVAMLAQMNPVGVVACAVFVAGIFVGADSMSRTLHVPSYIADVIVSTSLLFMLVALLVRRYRLRWS
jgi:simple sugar transport system permease protein